MIGTRLPGSCRLPSLAWNIGGSQDSLPHVSTGVFEGSRAVMSADIEPRWHVRGAETVLTGFEPQEGNRRLGHRGHVREGLRGHRIAKPLDRRGV